MRKAKVYGMVTETPLQWRDVIKTRSCRIIVAQHNYTDAAGSIRAAGLGSVTAGFLRKYGTGESGNPTELKATHGPDGQPLLGCVFVAEDRYTHNVSDFHRVTHEGVIGFEIKLSARTTLKPGDRCRVQGTKRNRPYEFRYTITKPGAVLAYVEGVGPTPGPSRLVPIDMIRRAA